MPIERKIIDAEVLFYEKYFIFFMQLVRYIVYRILAVAWPLPNLQVCFVQSFCDTLEYSDGLFISISTTDVVIHVEVAKFACSSYLLSAVSDKTRMA